MQPISSTMEQAAGQVRQLLAAGRLAEAESLARQMARLRPDAVEAHENLGVILNLTGRLQEAAEEFRQAIRLRPRQPWNYLNLGKTLRSLDELDEAEAAFRAALGAQANLPPGYHMLGSCLREAGRIHEAIECFRKAVALDGNFRQAHSNLCYAMHFDPDASPEQILEEHRAWERKFALPLRERWGRHENDPSPGRRLRIGYVSPYLRHHVIGFFMQPILEHHDHEQFEVVCYSDVPTGDDLTRRFRTQADLWRDTAPASDEDLAEVIRRDRIDVVIDLTLHMRGCRLRVFAQKPAPVQITHLAYCGTSGLSAMDWCITDPQMMSPGCDAYFSERLLPLDKTYWCYRRPANSSDVGLLPAQKTGQITFGSLNTLAKVNDKVIELWGKILSVVPGSRLAVHIPGGAAHSRSVLERFARHGIPAERLEPLARRPLNDYLDSYNRIDIALDPFPYGGGTTTLDALWMGVPVVTLAGRMPLARAGVTIMTNMGLAEMIADSSERYVELAADLAFDTARITELRSTLRQRLRGSALMDERPYVRSLEQAYRRAWQEWCEKG